MSCPCSLTDNVSTFRGDGIRGPDRQVGWCCLVGRQGERRVCGRWVAGAVSVFVCVECLFEFAYCAFLCLDAVREAREVLLVALPVGAQLV